MAKDYYQILGVSRTATDAEIQKAYRRLARKHHPDLAEDKKRAKEEFQKIQTAYDVLSDPEKRKLYDQLGPNFESYARAGQGQGGGQMPFDFAEMFGQRGGGAGMSMEDILRQFGGFGGARSTGGPPPFDFEGRPGMEPDVGRGDIRESITVPFQTAVLGGHHQLQLSRQNGAKSETIRLKIPAGITDGKTLRLRGQGDQSGRGKPGDLLVTVRVAPHPHFTRRGNNLHVLVPITVTEAIRGARIEVPSPHGTLTVTVPPRSSSGKLLRLSKMGIRPASSEPGDLLVELQIALPADEADESWSSLESLTESLPEYQPRKKLSW